MRVKHFGLKSFSFVFSALIIQDSCFECREDCPGLGMSRDMSSGYAVLQVEEMKM
jgi:hypothetical protein